jgi:hypothetical protein
MRGVKYWEITIRATAKKGTRFLPASLFAEGDVMN